MLPKGRSRGHDIVGDCDFRIAEPSADADSAPTSAPVHTPIHKDEDAKEMSDFETCRQACAAQNECCNNDVLQGSNQKLSCLQACMVVRSGVSKDECLDHCPVKACSREINGMEFNSCSVCDDVPAHKDAFGDDFKPVSYKCAARFGTNSQSCEAGCNAGAEGANAKASEHKHKRKHKRKPTSEPMDDSKTTPCPCPCPGPRRLKTLPNSWRPSTIRDGAHARAHGRFKVRLRAHARARARGG